MHYLKSISLLFFFLLALGAGLQAQDDARPTLFYQVVKLDDPNGGLMDAERKIMLPYFQERVNRGEIIWHGMYRVRYPMTGQQGYDYVSVALTDKFASLNLNNEDEVLQAALPDASTAQMWKKVRAESDIHSSEIFIGVDGLSPTTNEVEKFIQVNFMTVKPDQTEEYVKTESGIWKPIHAALLKKNVLASWLLGQRIMPGGSDFGPNYVTVDGFTDWPQIEKFNRELFPAAESVYPGEDLEKKLGGIVDLRTNNRSEIWELVASTTLPVKDKEVISVTEKGSGPTPMRGQQVSFDVNVMTKDGALVYDNQKMLGIPMEMVLGSDPYDAYLTSHLSQVGTGGKVTVSVPVAAQNMEMRGWSGNQDVTLKYHLREVGPPAMDGVSKLRDKIHEKGLSAAKAWHKKVSSEMADKYAFHEFTMNALGYDLMESGLLEEALYVMAENQRANPESFNAHDSLADAYSAMGNEVMAAKHYGRAVKINPAASASKEKLAALKK
ncbi:hypothetical protein [Neolewinella agarilytica]|uniref:Tetratricopeptide repeat-containing protein n=1 Tax=Neolewinella agarilytica TaxID=478744 RepID=A0A1H9NEQ3_9BACT|nr:hypothetical protein [Neolewinella agarilytica]SER33843.1 hypothetical protein SAMN05444359_1363 [Neolewinella agarilytica]